MGFGTLKSLLCDNGFGVSKGRLCGINNAFVTVVSGQSIQNGDGSCVIWGLFEYKFLKCVILIRYVFNVSYLSYTENNRYEILVFLC